MLLRYDACKLKCACIFGWRRAEGIGEPRVVDLHRNTQSVRVVGFVIQEIYPRT